MNYFVVSDVHGFYSYMKEALDQAGYDPTNENHFFISCGDLFDRGNQANECLDYVMSLPKDRRVFVDGNHEDLLIDLLTKQRGYADYDISNGTLDTIVQLAHKEDIYDFIFNTDVILNSLSKNEKLCTYLMELKDYYETKKYIFVHGWIPCDEYSLKVYPDWRQAEEIDWDTARWANGFFEWEKGMKDEKKTIVCGHWHTAYAHAKFHNKGVDIRYANGDYSNCCFDIFEDDGIIGLDACTVVSHKVNVLVIEE